MKTTVTRANVLHTATWAGGTTTQLHIYPAEATYKAFDFDYRISFATVETPTSTFTFMPGVTRHLMVLKGAIDLDHTNRHQQHLEPFQPYTFDGEWPTTAAVKVTDFNLMTRGKCEGKASALSVAPASEESVYIPGICICVGIYIYEGSASFQLVNRSEQLTLNAGDFLLLHPEGEAGQLKVKSIGTAALKAAVAMVSKG